MPARGVRTSPPVPAMARAVTMPTTRATTPIARYVPNPASSIQRKRPTGAVSSISMRPSDSSEAHPPTSAGGGEPGEDRAELHEEHLEREPGLGQVGVGERQAHDLLEGRCLRDDPRQVLRRHRDDERVDADTQPPGDRGVDPLAEGPGERPGQAEQPPRPRRQAQGTDVAEVASLEGDEADRRGDHDDPRERQERRPVGGPRDRPMVRRPARTTTARRSTRTARPTRDSRRRSQLPTRTTAAMPAAPPRPTKGARAKAMAPAVRPERPMARA